MAELKAIKPKTTKISASAISSSSPKLSQRRLSSEDPKYGINRKNRLVGSRSFTNEKKCPGIVIHNGIRNFNGLKTMQTEQKSVQNRNTRTLSNSSLSPIYPSKHHSQIPVLSRYQTNGHKQVRTMKKTPSGVKSREISTTQCQNKAAPGRERSTNNSTFTQSTSTSPFQCRRRKNERSFGAGKVLLNVRSRPSGNRNLTSDSVKRTDDNVNQCFISKTSASKKNSADNLDNNINYIKSYTALPLTPPRKLDLPVLILTADKTLRNTSVCSREEKQLTSNVSNSSLGLDIDSKSCSTGRTPRCSSSDATLMLNTFSNSAIEESHKNKLDLYIKYSETALDSAKREISRLSLKKIVSSESKDSSKVETLRPPQTTISTLSGDELVLTSSMEIDIEKELNRESRLPTKSEEAINQLLRETEEDGFIDNAVNVIQVIEDDANEYDSEATTDTDAPDRETEVTICKNDFDVESTNQSISEKLGLEAGEEFEPETSWRKRENELLMDVNYRQFVYHPAVLRRQTQDEFRGDKDRCKINSIENQCNCAESECDINVRSKNLLKSSFKKRNLSKIFVSNRDVNITPLRPWSEKMPQNEEKQIIDRLKLMNNSEYVLKDNKYERSKRERITVALLRLTVKVFHLLAIVNLWPGDNCQLLTSHSLQYGR